MRRESNRQSSMYADAVPCFATTRAGLVVMVGASLTGNCRSGRIMSRARFVVWSRAASLSQAEGQPKHLRTQRLRLSSGYSGLHPLQALVAAGCGTHKWLISNHVNQRPHMPHQRAHVPPISTALCIHGSAMRTKTPAPPDLIFANFYYSAKCLVPTKTPVAVAFNVSARADPLWSHPLIRSNSGSLPPVV